MCNIVGKIVKGPVDGEIFGGSPEKMIKIEDPLAHMLSYLREKQASYPGRTVGFKWKPYHDAQYKAVWEWVAQNHVRVVYNYRNPLDVLISSSRTHDEDGVYNCRTGDTKCLKTQLAIKVDVNVTSIVPKLEELKIEGIELVARLSHHNISYYDITYEEVNHGKMKDRIARVQLLADFIQPGRKINEKIFDTKNQYIGHYHQRETVRNYDELVAALNGTRYAKYLH
jgi:hypothetical protein